MKTYMAYDYNLESYTIKDELYNNGNILHNFNSANLINCIEAIPSIQQKYYRQNNDKLLIQLKNKIY